MDYFDANIWGLIVVPIGMVLCFGPAIIPWLIAEMRNPTKDSNNKKH